MKTNIVILCAKEFPSLAPGRLQMPGSNSAVGEAAQSAPSPPAEPSTHGITCTPHGPFRAQDIAHSIESGFTTLAAANKLC